MSVFITMTVQVAVLSPAFAVTIAVPWATAVTLPFASTVATDELLEDQVTVLFVALSGFTVAVSVRVSPVFRIVEVMSNVTDSTAMTFFLTVTEQVAVLSPALAVMVAVPSATAVTLPFASTVATEVLSELHVTVLFVALSGFTVAVRVAVSPSVSSSEDLSKVTDSTATVFFLTVTEQVAVLSPAFAVMVAVPSATADTLPLASTEATDALLDDQETVLFVALSGFTVAASVTDSPTLRETEVLSRLTDETAMTCGCEGVVWPWPGSGSGLPQATASPIRKAAISGSLKAFISVMQFIDMWSVSKYRHFYLNILFA